MKNKLKTLKDIYNYDNMSYISDEAEQVVDDLKDAAKEWFKHFKKARDFYSNPNEGVSDDYISNSGRIQHCVDMMSWIEEFFNLEGDRDEN